MITGSQDQILRTWDLETGAVSTKMVGHQEIVRAFAVSRDGQFKASGGWSGELIAWQGETRKLLHRTIGATNPERVLLWTSLPIEQY
jgi:WD40 repeat protein